MTGVADRLFVLHFGAERVGKSLSVRGADDAPFWAPFVGVLAETSAGLVLFDSGMSRATHDDPDVERIYRPDPPAEPDPRWHLYPQPPAGSRRSTWGWDGDPLVAALSAVGVAVGDLAPGGDQPPALGPQRRHRDAGRGRRADRDRR